MPKVVIPPPYRGPTQGEAHVAARGPTVGACLRSVEEAYPGFLAQVEAADGSVHRFVRLFRNGDPIEGDVWATPVSDDDEIEIVAAIAGG